MSKGDLLTVKQFAEKAGVSEQAIYKQLNKKLSGWVEEVEGVKMLKKSALKLYDHSTKGSTIQPTIQPVEQPDRTQEIIDALRDEIRARDSQIEGLRGQLAVKDKQIEQLGKYLDQQQQLTMVEFTAREKLEAKLQEIESKAKVAEEAGKDPAEDPGGTAAEKEDSGGVAAKDGGSDRARSVPEDPAEDPGAVTDQVGTQPEQPEWRGFFRRLFGRKQK